MTKKKEDRGEEKNKMDTVVVNFNLIYIFVFFILVNPWIIVLAQPIKFVNSQQDSLLQQAPQIGNDNVIRLMVIRSNNPIHEVLKFDFGLRQVSIDTISTQVTKVDDSTYLQLIYQLEKHFQLDYTVASSPSAKPGVRLEGQTAKWIFYAAKMQLLSISKPQKDLNKFNILNDGVE